MADLQDRIGMTARIAYESGGTGAFTSLLSSGSFTEFSERMEFMDRITAADADLVVAARVTREDLRREQRALTTLAAEQASAVAELQAQKEAIDSRLSEVSALVDTLRLRLAAAAARNHGPPPPGGLPLQACPLPGSSFTDDFGAPRPGGRTHQGIDMLAPFGTPIHAAQSGRFQQDYNDLGGISALVYAGNGDFTYYAHMEGYAGVGNGATVSAGAVIGYVGNTGDAQGGPSHLHFEYHPGGGGAVDPYSYLVALC